MQIELSDDDRALIVKALKEYDERAKRAHAVALHRGESNRRTWDQRMHLQHTFALIQRLKRKEPANV